MCGILGFTTRNGINNNKASELVLNGYYSQSERGQQSFGAVAGDNNQKVVVKSAKSLIDFTDRFTKNKILLTNATSTLIFHHRMASMGNVSKENTHPFVAGNICLVHNGTWSNASLWKGDFKGKLQGETDSEIIAHLINERGVESLKEIDGSASLVWLDKKDNTLNFWRNRTPMVLGYIKEMEILLFASTAKAVLTMADILGAKKIGGVFLPIYIQETVEHTHYKCSFEDNLLKIQKEIIEINPPPIFNFNDYNYNQSLYEYNNGIINKKRRKKTEKTEKTEIYTHALYDSNKHELAQEYPAVFPQNRDLFSNDIDWDDDPYEPLNKKLKK